MKIYTEVRIDIDTLEVIEEKSFEYSGEVALCKGGGTGIDKEYNSRMAGISEAQLQMAQEYFKFWQTDYKPYEQAQIKENTKMLPHLTGSTIAKADYEKAQYEGMLEKDEKGNTLLGLQQENERAKLEQSMTLMGDQTKVAQEMYKTALQGVDANAAANRAKADVAMGYQDASRSMRRDMGRMGLGGGGGNYASSMAQLARSRAKDQAGLMTQARTSAKNQQFSQLYAAAGLSLNK